MPPLIRVEGLTKRYGDIVAADDVTLDIEGGELFALLGGSGCGKSTLLRLIGGLETPTAGRVFIDGADVTDMPAYERPTNMVFQSYALFPHMTIAGNVGFGLKQERLSKAEISRRVEEALDLVRLSGLGGRKPNQLSGGQRQRVALARAIVLRPKVLLLDEPLSALDKKLREYTQFELMRLQSQLGITFVMVTHDQDEAMAMSTRIAVMDQGRVVEIGTPREIYERPQSRFVTDFIGGGQYSGCRTGGREQGQPARRRRDLRHDGIARRQRLDRAPPRTHRAVSHEAPPGGPWPSGIVEAVAFHGDFQLYRVRTDSWCRRARRRDA